MAVLKKGSAKENMGYMLWLGCAQPQHIASLSLLKNPFSVESTPTRSIETSEIFGWPISGTFFGLATSPASTSEVLAGFVQDSPEKGGKIGFLVAHPLYLVVLATIFPHVGASFGKIRFFPVLFQWSHSTALNGE